jgi:D-amino-acid dehydrogenase
MKILILGAGIIGVTSAYYLAKEGHEVSVIDINNSPGQGCSYANGAQLSFCHIEPWINRASIFNIIKNIFFINGSTSIHNLTDKNFLLWLLSFIRNSTNKNAIRNSKNLYKISSYSRELFLKIINEEKIDFSFASSGILHFFRSDKELQKAIMFYKKIGISFEYDILDRKQTLIKEPSLSKVDSISPLAGSLFFKNDYSGNCELFTQNLAKICHDKYKVKFIFNNKIQNILTNKRKITGVNTDLGVFYADNYIYALGYRGINLLKGIDINLKIKAIKGYSISSDISNINNSPKIAICDTKNRIVYSKINNIYRMAGLAEINNYSTNINPTKISLINKIASDSFQNIGKINKDSFWCAHRPVSHNYLPIIKCENKYGNLYLNTGHGSLGWTLSLASGMILNFLIAKKLPERFAFLQKTSNNIFLNK